MTFDTQRVELSSDETTMSSSFVDTSLSIANLKPGHTYFILNAPTISNDTSTAENHMRLVTSAGNQNASVFEHVGTNQSHVSSLTNVFTDITSCKIEFKTDTGTLTMHGTSDGFSHLVAFGMNAKDKFTNITTQNFVLASDETTASTSFIPGNMTFTLANRTGGKWLGICVYQGRAPTPSDVPCIVKVPVSVLNSILHEVISVNTLVRLDT